MSPSPLTCSARTLYLQMKIGNLILMLAYCTVACGEVAGERPTEPADSGRDASVRDSSVADSNRSGADGPIADVSNEPDSLMTGVDASDSGCSSGSTRCTGNSVETCGANAQWGSAVACDNQACMMGLRGRLCAGYAAVFGYRRCDVQCARAMGRSVALHDGHV